MKLPNVDLEYLPGIITFPVMLVLAIVGGALYFGAYVFVSLFISVKKADEWFEL